ncbi:MAG: hypothetical protein Q9205_007806 [Flavoplaca limonia]
MRDALRLILPKLAKVIHNLFRFALKFKDLPTLAFTHYQAAQPISLGRRAAQWAQDLAMDLEDFEYVLAGLKFRGAQGTTGSQASFMEIFHGDAAKIDELNKILCGKAGFEACYDISTQTYTRKVDLRIANALSAFGASAIRIATDIRHLAHDKILDEPHEATQTGSSAMAFKSNPMRSERICSLGRKLSTINTNFSATFSSVSKILSCVFPISYYHQQMWYRYRPTSVDISKCIAASQAKILSFSFATPSQLHRSIFRHANPRNLPQQWLERTLDDSAIRRIDIPEMFLLTDALLILLDDVTNGIVVFPAMIRSQLQQELPFMATENIIMKLVHKGVSRQEAHERIRVLSRETVEAMKTEGAKNDLIERIKKDDFFRPIWDELDGMLDPKLFIGRSAEIVEKYCEGPLRGQLEKYKDYIDSTATATLAV